MPAIYTICLYDDALSDFAGECDPIVYGRDDTRTRCMNRNTELIDGLSYRFTSAYRLPESDNGSSCTPLALTQRNDELLWNRRGTNGLGIRVRLVLGWANTAVEVEQLYAHNGAFTRVGVTLIDELSCPECIADVGVDEISSRSMQSTGQGSMHR